MKNPNQKKKLKSHSDPKVKIISPQIEAFHVEIEALRLELDNALEILNECRFLIYGMPVNSPEESQKKNGLLRRANEALNRIPVQQAKKQQD